MSIAASSIRDGRDVTAHIQSYLGMKIKAGRERVDA
jgi:hypothetical protein